MPGIKEVTHASWFGGIYQDERNFFPQFAVDVNTWRHMYSEFRFPTISGKSSPTTAREPSPERGSLSGLGGRWATAFRLKGAIYAGNWEFNLDGIYTGSRAADDTSQFWFHFEYLNESPAARSFKRTWSGWYIVRLNSPDDATGVVKADRRDVREFALGDQDRIPRSRLRRASRSRWVTSGF